MTPQRSNRQALIEGALRCLEESSSPRITARQIAAAAGASAGSIRYHFGSTEGLIGLAMEEGFRRWLREFEAELGDVEGLPLDGRLRRVAEVVVEGTARHAGLARAYLIAISRAPHDAGLRASLASSYEESRTTVARVLRLGSDGDAGAAASLLLATFDGLLIQEVLEPGAALNVLGLERGIARLLMAATPFPDAPNSPP